VVVVALDPARHGGAVLLDRGRCAAAAHWRPHTSGGRRCYALACAQATGDVHHQRGLPTPWAVGMALRRWLSPLVMVRGMGRAHVAAEGAHVGRNARSGLALARFGGALVGPLEGLDPDRAAQWAEPDQWRKLTFRRGWWSLQARADGKVASMRTANRLVLERWDAAAHLGVGREEVDRRMEAAAKALFMPKREAAKREAALVLPAAVPGLAQVAARVGGEEHVLDAAGVARWRQLQE
jgi:hypothetical protein